MLIIAIIYDDGGIYLLSKSNKDFKEYLTPVIEL
jgi:hypothetical protein